VIRFCVKPLLPRLCSVILCGLLIAGLAACGQPESLRIGFIGGLSGRVADLGIGGRNGATLAVEMRNRLGGVNGRTVKLIAEDDQQDPAIARSATARILSSRVEAIVGPMTSAIALEILPLANQTQVPLISPTVTSSLLTGKDDYFFRVVAQTTEYARKSAAFQYGRGLRRIASVHDLRNQAYCESWLQDFRTSFENQGGRLVTSLDFTSSNEQHFGEIARQLIATRADGILILANSVDAAMIAQQIRKLDARIHLATSEWAGTERLIELGGKAVEGMFVSQFIDRENSQPRFLAFRDAYRERFGHDPGFAGLTAFDATNVALDALEKRSAGQTLKQALLAQKRFSGAQSTIEFDDNGDAHRETYFTTVKAGLFVLVD
jgi:branched-chain amino acid transport system substrate-binding protein